MANDADVTSDAVSQAVATLFDLGRLNIDWGTVGRAVLAHREEARQRWLDHHDELVTPAPEDDLEVELTRRAIESAGDITALGLRAEATLLAALVRVAHEWQRLLAKQSPRLQRAVDHYAANSDPPPEHARAVVDEVARFAQEIGAFIREQGAQLEHDVLELQSQLLHVPTLEPVVRPRARVKP